jgi:hypothetical protein
MPVSCRVSSRCVVAFVVAVLVVPASAQTPVTRIKLPKAEASLLAGGSRTPDASAFNGDSRSILQGLGMPGASAYAPDPAFDRFVDPIAIGMAWAALDAAALTDGALGLMEGERVLLRPHRSLPTKDIAIVAARLAGERGDAASLARLEKAAAQHGREEMKQLLAQARTLGGASRAAAVPVDVGAVSAEAYQTCAGVSRAALRTRLTGNSRYILPIVTPEGDVVLPPNVPVTIDLPLRQKVVAMCGDLPEQPLVNATPLDALVDSLAAASRGREDWLPKERGENGYIVGCLVAREVFGLDVCKELDKDKDKDKK